jgi:hypothetical protein
MYNCIHVCAVSNEEVSKKKNFLKYGEKISIYNGAINYAYLISFRTQLTQVFDNRILTIKTP